jgi:hypothetical protein
VLLKLKKAELTHKMQTSQYEAAALESLALLSKSQIPKSRYSYLQQN